MMKKLRKLLRKLFQASFHYLPIVIGNEIYLMAVTTPDFSTLSQFPKFNWKLSFAMPTWKIDIHLVKSGSHDITSFDAEVLRLRNRSVCGKTGGPAGGLDRNLADFWAPQ